MNKTRPSKMALLTIVGFIAGVVGLLIFLWVSFGGSVPLAAQGYRFSVEFAQADELGTQAQVEIAGVPVGEVTSVSLDHRTGLTRAVLQIDHRFAPRPADTRAILRTKTLLGETYVELSAGKSNGPDLPDGGHLPRGQVQPTVELDQIFSTFDPRTRRAFETWMTQSGIALTGRGEQFNAALAELYPFATNLDAVLTVLRRRGAAVSTLLHDGGRVFSALSQSPGQLQGFVRNSNAVFAATASRDAELSATVRAFPLFLARARSSIDQLTSFSRTTRPLLTELQPAVNALNPVLKALTVLAPELRDLFTNVGPLTQAARAGLPALQRFLNETVPLLRRLTPYLGSLVPIINYVQSYRRELAGFFANGTAATQATGPAGNGIGNLHYVRSSTPINPDSLAPYPARPETDRGNPYLIPSGYDQLLKGLPVFASNLCTTNPLPSLAPSLAATTTEVAGTALTLAQLVKKYYFTNNPAGPACRAQSSLGALTTGQLKDFPQLTPLPSHH